MMDVVLAHSLASVDKPRVDPAVFVTCSIPRRSRPQNYATPWLRSIQIARDRVSVFSDPGKTCRERRLCIDFPEKKRAGGSHAPFALPPPLLTSTIDHMH